MRKVLVDINVFMDILQARQGIESSIRVISILRDRVKCCGFVSALTVPVLYYLQSRGQADLQARESVREILKEFAIVDLTEGLLQKAFAEENIPDLEDCIQYHSAKAALCTDIITRNTRDFRKVDLNVYTPEEFLSAIGSGS